jgi:hypothetical protein
VGIILCRVLLYYLRRGTRRDNDIARYKPMRLFLLIAVILFSMAAPFGGEYRVAEVFSGIFDGNGHLIWEEVLKWN